MGKSSGGGGGDSTTTIRYAPYVETAHSSFLSTMAAQRALVIGDSPFDTYTAPSVYDAFLGTGYVISSFPSLYDMYGKFMAGLDIEGLWQQLFTDTVESPEVGVLVAAEIAMMDDDIAITALPRFQTGMRDMNSVMASSFVIGKSLIEDARVKAIAKFSAELKYKLISVAQQRWEKHLEWNSGMIKAYLDIIKSLFVIKHDMDEQAFTMAAKDKLWPFTVLDYERAGLGALQGATTTSKDVAGGGTQSMMGGALSGAAAGWMVTREPVGAAVGAVLGGLAGLFG